MYTWCLGLLLTLQIMIGNVNPFNPLEMLRDRTAYPIIETEVDMITLAHVNNKTIMFFWDYVQEEYEIIAWEYANMDISKVAEMYLDDNKFKIFYIDDPAGTYRIISTTRIISSQEDEHPMAFNQQRQWFARKPLTGLPQVK